MKKLFLLQFFTFQLLAQTPNNEAFNRFLEETYTEDLQYSPFSATSIGVNKYNDQLYVEFTDSYKNKLNENTKKTLAQLNKFDRASLNENDQLSYDIFKYELERELESRKTPANRIPFNQMFSFPLTFAQYGSGKVTQPFKTNLDYQNWLSRAGKFPIWVDSAIVYMRKGIAEKVVLPKPLVKKMIGQMQSFVTTNASKSVFWGPIDTMPASFLDDDKKQFTQAYIQLIMGKIVPAYDKLATFLENEYLPNAGDHHGFGALPGGAAWYNNNLVQSTTTNKTADEIFKTGLSEVKRIRKEMEKVKKSVGFKGSLEAFFENMRTDPKLFPYKTADEIVAAYTSIEAKINPTLERLFLSKPKTAFEVRQTEAFRAASAAAQYNAGLADGSRPGIFYVPIIDPKTTPVRESLFIHEAVPGHHYQIMLQRENTNLPSFRRYGGYAAYAEGWGLYSESLGKDLGLYTDPYQYMKALGDEIHRAIRLVVDPGLHAKGWTREQAIKYMVDNEPISEPAATAEIERYMAIAGQATAYKTGSIKILELKARYKKLLGSKFNIADFHDQLLKDGAMPLAILEAKMDKWANSMK
jgi:uncharacterized protein (DUF885 family)